MNHKPMCRSNISCAVYHSDGICPHAGKCDCSCHLPQDTPQEDHPLMEIDYVWLNRAEGKLMPQLEAYIAQKVGEARGRVCEIIKDSFMITPFSQEEILAFKDNELALCTIALYTTKIHEEKQKLLSLIK